MAGGGDGAANVECWIEDGSEVRINSKLTRLIHVTKDFWGEDRFKAAWKEKDFPKNWRAMYRLDE